MMADRRLINYVDIDLACSDTTNFNTPLLATRAFAFSRRS